MSSKYALSVSLTEHLCAFIKRELACGGYSTASEIVRTALRLLESETNRSRPNEPTKTKPVDQTTSSAPASARVRARRGVS